MKVHDIMKPSPVAGTPGDTVEEAVRRMAAVGGRHLPVVEGERLVGIVSSHDLVAVLAATGDSGQTLGGIMQQPVQTCGPDDSLTEVTGRMSTAKIGSLPVTEKGRLVGLITITDVLFAQVLEGMDPATAIDSLTAGDIMTPDPTTVRPDDHVLDAAARMRQRRVRHLPVVDGAGTLVGMLSDRDIRQTVGDPSVAFGDTATIELETLKVDDVMSRAPLVVGTDATMVELARVLADLTVSAVPVVDPKRRPIGIVSYVDVLRAYATRR